ncbi:MAG TPA: hypothetical protein VGR27_01965 [Longimicrobiaceae bacterium]|nr:hypothetical protein [Longimicrobiaceae bacterium]
MRWLAFLLIATLIAACGWLATEPLPGLDPLSSSEVQAAQLVQDLGQWPADALEFQQLRIVGDTLEAVVSHSGGCAEHGYALVFMNVFLESDPVQMRGLLSHDAKGDPCRALLTRTLRFDLTPLKESYRANYRVTSGTIILGGNWPERLRYEF